MKRTRSNLILILVSVIVMSLPVSQSFSVQTADSSATQDTEWVNWVVVNMCPARVFSQAWKDDAKRLKLFQDFDPDVLDLWSGMRMNRGDFFRMRGVAVNGRLSNEYQESINDTAGHTLRMFAENGIGFRETGQPAKHSKRTYGGEYGMNMMTGRWKHMVEQHLYRQTDYVDLLFQDNIALPTTSLNMGFSDVCNQKFIAYMKQNFSPQQLADWKMGEPDDFHIRDYLQLKRQETGISLHKHRQPGANVDALLLAPILHEYIRFQHIEHVAILKRLKDGIARAATRYGKPCPSFVGNQSGAQGHRPMAALQSQTTDVVWIECSEMAQPCFGGPRQGRSTLVYKAGIATGNFDKPIWAIQYPTGFDFGEDKRLPLQLSAAEAYANGGVPILGFTLSMHRDAKTDTPVWNAYAQIAQFAGEHRGLFVDRKRMANVGVVYSLTSNFWRQFSSLSTEIEHNKHLGATARLLEDYQIPFEVIAFGHPDVFDDQRALEKLPQYQVVILPQVDCVSDRHVQALQRFVQRGGKLVLWGSKNGTRDEEMRPRSKPAFTRLQRSPGLGQVVQINDEQISRYVDPQRILIPTAEEGGSDWKFTVDSPGPQWNKPDFDDGAWNRGQIPFGVKKKYARDVKTNWESEDIWLRKKIYLKEVPNEPAIRFRQRGIQRIWVGELAMRPPDQGFQVYINGVFAGAKGFTYSPYYTLPLNSKSTSSFRKGENVIAVHARQVLEGFQFFEAGMQDYSDDSALAAIVRPQHSILETDAGRSLWVNTFQHGSGPMWSIGMVNYDINLDKDEYIPTGPIKLTVRHPEPQRIREVRYYSFGDDVRPLPFNLTDDGAIQITVPQLNIWGTVVLGSASEIDARLTAAHTRKWQQRLRIAMRCEDQNTASRQRLLADADDFLRQCQGPAKLKNFASLKNQTEKWTARLQSQVEAITADVQKRPNESRKGLDSIQAVKKFDFGSEDTETGWTPITTKTAYNSKQGYGWVKPSKHMVWQDHKKPDAVLGDFIRPQGAHEITPPYSVVNNRAFPLAYPAEHPEGFRVDIPNGQYVVTLITGSHEPPANLSDEGTVALTYVDVEEDLTLLGQPIRTGAWQQRCFPVQVSNGRLMLRFHGPNVGPYFHNTVEWMVAGIIIQKTGQKLTTPAAESLTRWQQLNRAQIRDWLVAGPFGDPHWRGLDIQFEPQRHCRPNDTYRADFLGRQVMRSWQPYHAGKNAQAVVPLYSLLDDWDGRGLASRGAAGFGFTQVYCENPKELKLIGSMSGQGAVYLNGSEVIRDEIVMGLVPREFSARVTLRKGWNQILVKSLHCWLGEWSFHLALMRLDGSPETDIKIDADREINIPPSAN